jgi:hypothetical protein
VPRRVCERLEICDWYATPKPRVHSGAFDEALGGQTRAKLWKGVLAIARTLEK